MILLSELAINEMFDFKNVEEYPIQSTCHQGNSRGKFTLDSGDEVQLQTNEFPMNWGGYSEKLPKEYNTDKNNFFDLSFTVEGEPSKYTNTDLKEFTRILKTVFTWIKEEAIPCIERTSSSPNPIFHISSHARDFHPSYEYHGDPVKDRIYKYLINKYLPSGYRKSELYSKQYRKNVIVFQKED
jgi:hypothetical protein